jgi:hypothetical protein
MKYVHTEASLLDFDDDQLDQIKESMLIDKTEEIQFVAPISAIRGARPFIGPAIQAARAVLPPQARDMFDMAMPVLTSQNSQDVFIRIGSKLKDKIRSNNSQRRRGGDDGNGGGNTIPSTNVREGNSSGPMYAFKNAKPLSISISTPITERTALEDLADGRPDEPTLHVSACKLFFQKDSTDNVLYKRFEEVIATDFQNLASRAVNFNIDAVTVFSAIRLTGYWNRVCTALQVYYFYTSIIAYEDNIPHNKNTGMKWFRDSMTSEEFNLLDNLERVIRSLPIPPRINQVSFFLMQNFKVRDTAFSPICKFMPFGFDPSTGFPTQYGNNGLILQSAIDGLLADRELTTKMATFCSSWIDIALFAPSPEPVINDTLSNIWINAPRTTNYGMDQTFAMPLVTSDDQNIKYSSCTDTPDALAVALQTVYQSSGPNGYLPNMFTPIASSVSNGISESNFSFVNGEWVVPVQDWSNAAFDAAKQSRGQSNCVVKTNSFAISTQLVPGCNTVQYVNLNTIRYSAKQLVEWLTNLEELMTKVAENEGRTRAYTPTKPGGR